MLHVIVHENASILVGDSHCSQELACLHKNDCNVKTKVSHVDLNPQWLYDVLVIIPSRPTLNYSLEIEHAW